MIKKILSVSNVGKLRKHAAAGDQTFRRLTVIYGDNAIGKTTLAAILDSLREGSSDVILGRTTLGSNAEPAVSILTSGGVRAFADGQWDAAYPALEVFYSDFVSRAVFCGDHVSYDQQKDLCSLLVGRTAIAEGRRLGEFRVESNQVNARMRELESAIRSHIHGAIEVTDFLKLPERKDIDKLIAEARQKLVAAKDLAAILSKAVPDRTELPTPDDASLLEALGRSIDSISADAIARVTAHWAERMGDAGERWLREGMQYVAEAHCPFCDQSLDASDFFVALQQYFSDAYTEYERSLEVDLGVLRRQFDPAELERAAERMLRQRVVAITWVGQVASLDSSTLSSDLSAAIGDAIQACSAVGEVVSKKQNNPLRAIDTSSLGPHLRSLHEALAALRAADDQVGAAMRDIAAFQQSVKASNPETLRHLLDELQNHQGRHDPSVAPLCEEYLELIERKERITGGQSAARAQMKQSMDTLLTRYRDEMNGYLKYFGSIIRIENPRTNHQTKPPSVEYSLNIDGTSVPLGKPTAPKDVPCFGNTLSEGEKNLFALSLFLAHVKNRPDLNDVVVVVDDPVNSLDQDRRLMIAETLLSMLDELAQVIVLTHEPRLAHMLCRSQPSGECRMLCIRKEKGSSCVREWDSMNRDLATDYFRNYFTIADFLEGRSVSWELVSRSLRPFLEDYLRQRFPGEFGVDEWLGDMADRIEGATENHRLAPLKSKLGDIRLVAKATNPTHHGSTHLPGAERLNRSSTELYARKALDVIC